VIMWRIVTWSDASLNKLRIPDSVTEQVGCWCLVGWLSAQAQLPL